MDTLCLSTALVILSEEFNDYKYSYWAIMAYALAYVGKQSINFLSKLLTNSFTGGGVIFARLGDVYGRKPSVLGAFAIFGVFSIGCAASQSLNQLIFFRALQGAGGAGLYAMVCVLAISYSTHIVNSLIDNDHPARVSTSQIAPVHRCICRPRSRVSWHGRSYSRRCSSIKSLVALDILAKVRVQVSHLESCYKTNFRESIPCTSIPATILYFVWERDDNWQKVLHLELHQLDFVGLALLLTGSILLAFNLEEAGTYTFAWDSPLVITLFIISGSSFIALVFWQWYISRPRGTTYIAAQFPWRIMTDRVMMCGIM